MLGNELTFEDIQGNKPSAKKKFCGTWLPDSNTKSTWDILGFFFIVYQAVAVPYRISFDV